MRPIWKGAICFGLVNIPVGLYSATSSAEKIKFRQLRASDHSAIKNKRVAEVDGEEVPCHNEYAEALMKMIEKKIAAGGKELPLVSGRGAPHATNVVDIVAMPQESINRHVKKAVAEPKKARKRALSFCSVPGYCLEEHGIDFPRTILRSALP